MSRIVTKTHVQTSSLTLTDMGGKLGEVVTVGGGDSYHGNKYMLVQANGAIADGAICEVLAFTLAPVTGGILYEVGLVTDVKDFVFCANATDSIVADNAFWWGLIRGYWSAFTDGNVTAIGKPIAPDATDGAVTDAVTLTSVCGVALAVDVATRGPCYFVQGGSL